MSASIPAASRMPGVAAAGSALGGWAYAHGGWSPTTWAGLGLPVQALICFLTEQPENLSDGDRP